MILLGSTLTFRRRVNLSLRFRCVRPTDYAWPLTYTYKLQFCYIYINTLALAMTTQSNKAEQCLFTTHIYGGIKKRSSLSPCATVDGDKQSIWQIARAVWWTEDQKVLVTGSMPPQFHKQIQELIRRWDSEREHFVRRQHTCRGQRLCPLNRLVNFYFLL